MSNQLILSLTTPILSYDEYAKLQGQSVRDVFNAVAKGRLPIYTPPCGPHENPAKLKKYINMVALYAEAAKAANLELGMNG